MHDGKLLLNALDSLWKQYQKRLTICRHEASEEAVHKLRISARRLLSLIELLQALAPQQALRKLRKSLKALLDDFDELRDTQVMLLEVSGTLDTLPGLAPFQQHLQLIEQQLLAQTPAIIENLHSKSLDQRLEKVHKNLAAEFGKTELKQSVISIIDSVFQAAMERYQSMDPRQPFTIHRLRIAVKKLRYMLASAQELLPFLPDNHLKQLQNYLTSMGEIQNSYVLQNSLTTFFAGQPPTSIQAHYLQRHQAIVDKFLVNHADIMRFWRASPNQAFPWEF